MKILKFLSVLIMIFVHAHLFLISNDGVVIDQTGQLFQYTKKFSFLFLFIMFLPILAGFNFRNENNFEYKNAVKYSILLFVIGLIMNIFVFGFKYVFSWNILQLISVSMIFTIYTFKNWKIKKVYWFIFLSILLSQLIAYFLLKVKSLPFFFILNVIFGSQIGFVLWPLFPWVAMFMFGFYFSDLYGKAILNKNDNKNFNKKIFYYASLFLFFGLITGGAFPEIYHGMIWSSTFFQPSPAFLLSGIGVFIILFLGFQKYSKDIIFFEYGIINIFSKSILFIYLFQMFLSYKLSFFLKKHYIFNTASLGYFVFIAFVLISSYLFGAIVFYLLNKKKFVINLIKK